MARYIDAELLTWKLSRMIDYYEKANKVSGLSALFSVGDAIMDCPTADVAPRSEVACEVIHSIVEKTNELMRDQTFKKSLPYLKVLSEVQKIYEKYKGE